MLLVVVESPLSAPTRQGIEENKKYARECVLDCLRRGEAPYASHLLFDQPGLLDDTDADQRKLGMEAGFMWGRLAHLIAVYVDRGISTGMQRGIDFYRGEGIEVEYRKLG